MKTKQVLVAAVVISSFVIRHSSFGQGTLTPPGPPGPTMLTLSQIEPRTPVDALHTPGDANSMFAITNPGSYYLTTNLYSPIKPYLISINANNVAIDLSGFSLLGNGLTSQGINIPNFQTNVMICNGMIYGFTAYGVYCANDYFGHFDRLIVSQNGYAGLACGREGIVRDCEAANNSYDGFLVSGNCLVENCLAFNNGSTGIHLYERGSRIDNNHLAHNGIGLQVEASGNLIVQNSATGSITNNYSIVAGNVVGPSVNSANIGTNSYPDANYDF